MPYFPKSPEEPAFQIRRRLINQNCSANISALGRSFTPQLGKNTARIPPNGDNAHFFPA